MEKALQAIQKYKNELTTENAVQRLGLLKDFVIKRGYDNDGILELYDFTLDFFQRQKLKFKECFPNSDINTTSEFKRLIIEYYGGLQHTKEEKIGDSEVYQEAMRLFNSGNLETQLWCRGTWNITKHKHNVLVDKINFLIKQLKNLKTKKTVNSQIEKIEEVIDGAFRDGIIQEDLKEYYNEKIDDMRFFYLKKVEETSNFFKRLAK